MPVSVDEDISAEVLFFPMCAVEESQAGPAVAEGELPGKAKAWAAKVRRDYAFRWKGRWGRGGRWRGLVSDSLIICLKWNHMEVMGKSDMPAGCP